MADWRSLGLDFVTLRVFKAAVEEQSLVAAAEREHLAASAISRRIAEFESRLGIELLRRHDRGVEPTAAGKVLMRHVKSLFDVVEVTLSDLESLTLGHTGEVRISASLSMISSLLPPILGEVRAAHPGIDLQVEQENSEDILTGLSRGTTDIGFISGIPAPDSLTCFDFIAEPLEVILPAAHPLAGLTEGVRLSQLTISDYVGLHSDLALQRLICRNAVGQEIDLRAIVTVGGFDTLARYVAVGMGVSIVPRFHACEACKLHGLVRLPLLEEWAVRKTQVCVRSVTHLSAAAKGVLDTILHKRPDMPERNEDLAFRI